MKRMPDKFYRVLDFVGFSAVIVIATSAVFLILRHAMRIGFPSLNEVGIALTIGATAILVVLVAAHFIAVFTRDLTENEDKDPSYRDGAMLKKLRAVFIYGYIIMLASLCFSAAPFFVPIDESKPRSDSRLSAGLVVACRSDNCDRIEADPQWYVHIGSSITQVHASPDSEPPVEEATAASPQLKKVAALSGGLSVPLYIVVLALMGGAVSMIRRVPEYQKQVAGAPNADGAIAPIRARELVVFQIMQLFSAPLLAITAFAVIDPQTAMAGALLGFFSGFSSETILLRLRTAAESLSGKPKDDDGDPKKPDGNREPEADQVPKAEQVPEADQKPGADQEHGGEQGAER